MVGHTAVCKPVDADVRAFLADKTIAYPHKYNGIESGIEVNFGSNCKYNDDVDNNFYWFEFPLLSNEEKWCQKDGSKFASGEYRAVFAVPGDGSTAPATIYYCGVMWHRTGVGNPFGICHP